VPGGASYPPRMITEIARDVFRISRFHPGYGIQFNQFLMRGEEPFLMHTGFRKGFAEMRDDVAKVIDPASLRWIGFGHFEPDECGALNEWLRAAPRAQAVSSFVGANVMLDDYAERPARVLADDETLDLGAHRIRFLSTPHFPHGWDAGLFFEETDRTLLCSDLFFQPGDPEPLIEADVVERAAGPVRASTAGPMAHDMPFTPHTRATLDRLAALDPRTLAIMHGSSYRGDGARAIRELASVIEETLG
jgi:flavorubredoxin